MTGHSPGTLFVDEKEKVIFAGDVLFHGSIGRTDLWMGDMDLLLESIRTKLFTFDNDFIVFPGHMDETTIGEEKENNPFLNGEYDKYA
jgi:glyoxylase-like metal-dependent hydrolase (beta-lactamase superfamily II)